MSSQKKILLVITASVAAFKALELISILQKKEYNIEVVLTKAAQKFITALSVTALTGKDVHQDLFSDSEESSMRHINLSRENDLIVIYPATADFIAKLAMGKADDLASAMVLASNKPIMLAPAMNVMMWSNNITQANIKKIEASNAIILRPLKGKLACGEEGEGRVVEADYCAKEIDDYFQRRNLLQGKKIIVTVGATIEKIDPVRFISNFSSGKQGIAIAKICKSYGADVTVIKAKTDCKVPQNLKIINVLSADDMLCEVNKLLSNKIDVAFCVAAVADYKVKSFNDSKIKKNSKNDLQLNLALNPDILYEISNHNNRPKFIVGFAAETNDLLKNAKEKLVKKNCDMIIANDISKNRVFGEDSNKIHIITKQISKSYNLMSKDLAAREIIDYLIKILW